MNWFVSLEGCSWAVRLIFVADFSVRTSLLAPFLTYLLERFTSAFILVARGQARALSLPSWQHQLVWTRHDNIFVSWAHFLASSMTAVSRPRFLYAVRFQRVITMLHLSSTYSWIPFQTDAHPVAERALHCRGHHPSGQAGSQRLRSPLAQVRIRPQHVHRDCPLR